MGCFMRSKYFSLLLSLFFALQANAYPKTLVLAIDGIGYSLFKDLRDAGYFRNFRPPAQMVSTFPSLSDPAWILITNSPTGQSYQKEFFDLRVKTKKGIGKHSGNLLDHLSKPPLYEQGFDFKPEGLFQHLATMTWTETTAFYWIDALEREFFKSKKKDGFFALLINTDILGHTKGKKPLLEYLVELDKKLKRLEKIYKKKTGTSLEIIMVSDHGLAFSKPKPIQLDDFLKKNGWNFAKTLKDTKDVTYVFAEIVAFAALYCLDDSREKLARDLSSIDGVQSSMFPSGTNTVDIFSESGKNHSRITVYPKTKKIDYKLLKGKDPYDQIHMFAKGPLNLNKYFIETLSHVYPDALYRIWQGFYKVVLQKPSVMINPKLGYVFANPSLKFLTLLTGLEGTHGSLHKEESVGIITSTKRLLPPIRPEQFKNFVNLKDFGQKKTH
jgi:hypothetical protein